MTDIRTRVENDIPLWDRQLVETDQGSVSAERSGTTFFLPGQPVGGATSQGTNSPGTRLATIAAIGVAIAALVAAVWREAT